MFDSVVVKTGGPVDQTVTATQKLAPTAEHMRLLNEFREEAFKSVIDAHPVECGLAGRGVCVRTRDPAYLRTAYTFVFKTPCNERIHKTFYPESRYAGEPEQVDSVLKQAREWLAGKLLQQVKLEAR